MKHLAPLVLLVLLLCPLGSQAASNSPFLNPEVVKAAVAIQMSAEQSAEFRKITGEFGDSLGPAFSKLVQRTNPAHLPRKWRTKRGRLVKDMNKKMAAVLTDEQYPLYEQYVEVLLEKMDEQAAQRAR